MNALRKILVLQLFVFTVLLAADVLISTSQNKVQQQEFNDFAATLDISDK
jgi:hypothetical protein